MIKWKIKQQHVFITELEPAAWPVLSQYGYIPYERWCEREIDRAKKAYGDDDIYIHRINGKCCLARKWRWHGEEI